jgi:alpha-L-fucosidase 2
MPPGNILAAAYLGLEQDGGWEEVPAAVPSPGFFISVHDMRGPYGIVYLARKVQVAEAGDLILHVGHDGGARVFLDGEAIGGTAGAVNPAPLTRTSARVTLAAGEHEIVVALDRAGFTDCAGIGGTSGQDFRSHWGQACMGHLPWAMHNYWMILRRSMDEPRMRDKFFPLLRQTINTHLHLINKGDDGRWHLPNSSSPEYPDGWVPDTNYDLALLRWGCQTLVELCTRFNIDDPLLPKWKDVLANLAEYPTDANGFMVGAGLPFAMAHRHWSHLLAIYPLYLVNVDQPDARTLIAKSLRHFMSFEPTKGGDRTPYTWAAASSMASALGAGDLALQYLNGTKLKLVGQDGLQGVSQNTTMYRECNNPCMETPLFMAQSIHEMLIQSWGGTIRIFPACPSGWKDAAFDYLRAEGAFLVSAVRREGKTEWVRITSLAGEPCRVNVEGQTRELKLAKGETIIIHPGPQKMAPVIAPVVITESNCFGKRD